MSAFLAQFSSLPSLCKDTTAVGRHEYLLMGGIGFLVLLPKDKYSRPMRRERSPQPWVMWVWDLDPFMLSPIASDQCPPVKLVGRHEYLLMWLSLSLPPQDKYELLPSGDLE